MPAKVSCPSCSRQLLVPDELQGRSVRCPSCETVFTAQAESSAPASPPPPPRSAPDDFERIRQDTGGTSREEPDDRPWTHDRREDEYYDRPELGRRPSYYGGQGSALDAVSGPATALQVVAGIKLALMILGTCGLVFLLAGGQNRGGNGPDQRRQLVLNLGSVVIGIVQAGVILWGAGCMKRMENYGAAMTASIVALIPCSGCCILLIPFGIWSLVVLSKPEVKASFR
jgi:predicted Zn finger-like uncharacterized protein